MKVFSTIALCVWASMAYAGDRDTIHQFSTIDALLAGVYDGTGTVARLLAHGDTGLGTFNGLDGEMVCVDGRVYRVAADGRAREMPPGERTPFAVVTWFDREQSLPPFSASHLEECLHHLDQMIPSENFFYTLRMEGEFEYVKTRSVPRQNPPYRPLAEVYHAQSIFEFHRVHGVLVGFRCPPFVRGMNVPGWHLHFLTADRTAGGHVLDLRFQAQTGHLDKAAAMRIELPESAAFATADQRKDREQELHQVEK